MKTPDIQRWGTLQDSTSRMTRLLQRQQVVSAIREDLCSEGFLEVETPLLVKSTCPEAYIDTVEVGNHYLVTSTEYQIKRLMAGGFQKVFTLTKNFRAHDQGDYHSAEFTMLEWARAGEALKTIEEDTVRFIRKAFQKLYPGKERIHFNGVELDMMAQQWEHFTVREAFQHHLGLRGLEDFSLQPLCRAAQAAGIALPETFKDDCCLVLSYLLDLLQPCLGKKVPTFLHEWPLYMTSSAPKNDKDPFTAERTELYIGGVEISNGFPFLRDADKQKELFANQLRKRAEMGKPAVAIDERYIASLPALPQGAGMALGIDRLAMVLTGSKRLTDVQAFDWEEL